MYFKSYRSIAIEANKLIAGQRFTDNHQDLWAYGGAPIYIGGDELVFFAPVASRSLVGGEMIFQTVFHLIDRIDQKFNEIFNSKNKVDNTYNNYPSLTESERPCMTYGITFTYIKSPLQEAFEESRNLMNEIKKGEKHETRNRIHFKVQKHSGQFYGGVIDKNTDILQSFLTLLDEKNNSSLVKQDALVFINSIVQKLMIYEKTIIACASEPDRIQDLFDNVFNETIHDQYRTYLNTICIMIQKALNDYCKDKSMVTEDRHREVIRTVHGILRFIHFIRDNEFRN